MTVIFHPLVKRDFREVLDDYDARSGSAGDRFFREFEQAVTKVKRNPAGFHRLDRARRRCNLPGFPYHLIDEVHRDVVMVTALRHHRRHSSFGLGRKWRSS